MKGGNLVINIQWESILFTIINILILYFILKKFLIKPINDTIAKREKLIHDRLEDAKNSQIKAEEIQKSYEAKMTVADDEAHDIVEKAETEAKKLYQDKIQEAEVEASKIISIAKQEAIIEKDKALADTKDKIVDIAMDIARQVTSSELAIKESKDIYDVFLETADDVFEVQKKGDGQDEK